MDGVNLANTNVQATNCTLAENGNAGLFTQNSNVNIVNSTLYDNTNFGIFNNSSSPVVIATNNWWGHPTGPYHATLNPDGQGDAVSDFVEFDPWTTYIGPREPVEITLEQIITGTINLGNYKDFFLYTPSDVSLVVELIPGDGINTAWLYSRIGDLPTWNSYDLLTKDPNNSGKVEILIPQTQEGVYYYSVYGRNIDPAGGDYQFRVYAVDRYLSNVSPNTGGNAGELSVRITGLPFKSGMQAELRSDGLPTIVASEVIVSQAPAFGQNST